MVELTSDGAGRWSCTGGGEGAPDLPAAGGDHSVLEGALDVHLGFSPMTNLIPVRRSGLYLGPGRSSTSSPPGYRCRTSRCTASSSATVQAPG